MNGFSIKHAIIALFCCFSNLSLSLFFIFPGSGGILLCPSRSALVRREGTRGSVEWVSGAHLSPGGWQPAGRTNYVADHRSAHFVSCIFMCVFSRRKNYVSNALLMAHTNVTSFFFLIHFACFTYIFFTRSSPILITVFESCIREPTTIPRKNNINSSISTRSGTVRVRSDSDISSSDTNNMDSSRSPFHHSSGNSSSNAYSDLPTSSNAYEDVELDEVSFDTSGKANAVHHV